MTLGGNANKLPATMIPLIGILLCIYLVFKGFEIFQVALVAPSSAGRSTGIVLGIIALIVSVVIAAFFAFAFVSSSVNVPPGLAR